MALKQRVKTRWYGDKQHKDGVNTDGDMAWSSTCETTILGTYIPHQTPLEGLINDNQKEDNQSACLKSSAQYWLFWYKSIHLTYKRFAWLAYTMKSTCIKREFVSKWPVSTPLIPRLLTYLGQESSQVLLKKSFHTTWSSIASLISLVLSSPVSALMVSMYVVLGLLRFGGPYWGFPKKHFWGSLFIAKKLIGLRTIRE